MSVMSVVVGWYHNLLKDTDAVEVVDEITLSQQGYAFEHEELKRLMDRLKGFATVKITDVYNAPLSPESIDQRRGPDGGIDCVIHIIAPTERGARQIASRVRNILLRGDY